MPKWPLKAAKEQVVDGVGHPVHSCSMNSSDPDLASVAEKQATLKRCALFQDLKETSLAAFVLEVRSRTFQARDVICARGTAGTEFFVMHSGRAEITVPTSQRSETEGRSEFRVEDSLLRSMGPGEFFGEIACLEDHGLRTATVSAAEASVVLVVPQDAFVSLLNSCPQAGLAVARHLARRVRFHTDRMVGLTRPMDVEAADADRRTRWEVFSDWMSRWSAQLSFTLANISLWVVWLGYDLPNVRSQILSINGLTMWLSLQAILMTTFVLVAQSRAEKREQRRKDLQYQWALRNLERTDAVLVRLNEMGVSARLKAE